MMIENGFSSPRRNEVLPVGLRVLVVDDDLAWLKILEKMLKKCSYEVTTCTLAQEALQLLRDRKGGFDIVISDVNMPDMDGFKLLEHVGLEMDLPVIMMSVDGETSKVMKGVQHGACDYLLKPIRMKELKNIWQHVVRKRMHEGREIDGYEDKIRSDSSYSGYYSGDQSLLRKRKDVENKHDEKESVDSYSMKKARVVWTVELHQKFVKAVNHIGIDSDKIGPKKILDLMNVPWLTRENVASHLQKYRLYLSRIRKEDETEDKIESSCGAMKNPDHPPKDNGETFHVTNPTSRQQNDISSTQVYPENPLPANAVGAMTPFGADLKGSNLLPLIDETKPFNDDKTRVSEVGVDCSFTPFDSPISGCYPWNTDISSMQFETEYKPHFSLEDCFIQPTPPLVQQPILAPLRISESQDLIESKYMNVEREVNNIGQQFPIEKELESMLGTNDEAFSCAYEEASLGGMKNHKSNDSIQSSVSTVNAQNLLESSIDQSFPLLSTSPLLSQQGFDPEIDMTKNQSSNLSNNISQDLRNEIDFGLLGEDFAFWWLQGGFDHIGLSDFNIPGHVNDVPFLKFGPDYDVFDCKECHVDHGLLF